VAQLDLEGGKDHYEYVLSKDSTSVGALMGLSRIYAILKNNAGAIHYLSLLLEQDPHYAEAYFLKGMIYRADFYETGRQESWDRALSSYQTAVEQNPDYYSAYVEMGVMHDQIGSDLAMDYYNSALAIYPESIEAWYNIGMFYQKRGQIDTALATYRTLNSIDSTYADAYYNQGYIHLIVKKQIDSAVFYFSRATNFDPEYFQAYNNLGLCYEELGEKEKARTFYQKAVEINPDFQLAKDNLNRLR
jgi:tetratricopeptide (TPR) repeat protein